jgi:shikimate kinase
MPGSHERFCDPKKLQEILEKENDICVMTGTASNQDEYLHLFDKVFLLQCKPETFVHRLQTRTANPFAGTPHEQELVVEWQKTFDKHMVEMGAVPISSEGSVDQVVDVLMKVIEKN